MYHHSIDISLRWSEKRLTGGKTPPLHCCTSSLHEPILNALGLTRWRGASPRGSRDRGCPTYSWLGKSYGLMMFNAIRPV